MGNGGDTGIAIAIVFCHNLNSMNFSIDWNSNSIVSFIFSSEIQKDRAEQQTRRLARQSDAPLVVLVRQRRGGVRHREADHVEARELAQRGGELDAHLR